MKKLSLVSLLLCIILILSSCNSQVIETLKKENEDLKSSNEKLQVEVKNLNDELESIKFGAENLLKEANNYYESKEYSKAVYSIETLLEKHPGSDEAKEAQALLSKVEEAQKKEQEAKALEEKKRIEAEKKRLAEATSKMRKKYDEVQEITWYYDKSTPQYSNYNSFHLYIGVKNNNPWLRFCIQYAGDDWLFIDRYELKIDDYNYEIIPEEVERDNNADVWEWYDTDVDSSDIAIIKAVISSKRTIIRCVGRQYHKDRTISEQEKKALQNVLDAYEALGGNMNF